MLFRSVILSATPFKRAFSRAMASQFRLSQDHQASYDSGEPQPIMVRSQPNVSQVRNMTKLAFFIDNAHHFHEPVKRSCQMRPHFIRLLEDLDVNGSQKRSIRIETAFFLQREKPLDDVMLMQRGWRRRTIWW